MAARALRRLILFRHGQAEAAAPAGSDAERALTPQGRADATASGRWLAEQGALPELALVSPAVRAVQTWEAAREALPDTGAEIVDALYGADPNRLLATARDCGAGAVLIVAHNPGLHALAVQLAIGGATPPSLRADIARSFPPATVAIFGLDPAGAFAGEALHLPSRYQEAAGR